jgi:probable phosphoglycerate mutase
MPPVTRVLAIRHGETTWNAEGRMQGQLDTALSEHGRWQARQMAAALAGEGIDAICSSDLARAFDTAGFLAEQTGAVLTTDRALRERGFGHFEGLTYAEIDLRFPPEAERWRRREPDFAPAGGETLRAFNDRCLGACVRLAAAHAGQTLAIVAHGGVLDCLYRAASRVELQAPRSWELVNAGINRLLYSEAGGFTLVGWNDSRHLEEVGLDEGADGQAHPAAPALSAGAR